MIGLRSCLSKIGTRQCVVKIKISHHIFVELRKQYFHFYQIKQCTKAAAGLHEMAGHSDTQCKTEIRRDLSYSFLQDKGFIQPIICLEKITAIMQILSPSFVSLRGVLFVYVTLCITTDPDSYSATQASMADQSHQQRHPR